MVVAALLLVTVILPAEHGVDPTGVGRLLGLTAMGEIKASLAAEAAREETVVPALRVEPAPEVHVAAPPTDAPAIATPSSTEATPPAESQPATAASTHVTEVVLSPNEGKEIKLVMRKDASVTFSWSTDRGVVNYDLHADAPGIKYHGYSKGSGKPSDEGILVAAFDGAHGWFWRNRGRETVTVTLRTTGDYQDLKRP